MSHQPFMLLLTSHRARRGKNISLCRGRVGKLLIGASGLNVFVTRQWIVEHHVMTTWNSTFLACTNWEKARQTFGVLGTIIWDVQLFNTLQPKLRCNVSEVVVNMSWTGCEAEETIFLFYSFSHCDSSTICFGCKCLLLFNLFTEQLYKPQTLVVQTHMQKIVWRHYFLLWNVLHNLISSLWIF